MCVWQNPIGVLEFRRVQHNLEPVESFTVLDQVCGFQLRPNTPICARCTAQCCCSKYLTEKFTGLDQVRHRPRPGQAVHLHLISLPCTAPKVTRRFPHGAGAGAGVPLVGAAGACDGEPFQAHTRRGRFASDGLLRLRLAGFCSVQVNDDAAP